MINNCMLKGIICEFATKEGYCCLSSCQKYFGETYLQEKPIEKLPDELTINGLRYRRVKDNE